MAVEVKTLRFETNLRYSTAHRSQASPRTLVAVVAFALWSGSGAAETVLHVSPTGNDAWSGRLAEPAADQSDGPLASLAAARDRIRGLRTSTANAAPMRVVVADGSYTLTDTFVLGPDDGGIADAPVVYEAAAGARPRFSGGRRITGWKPHPDGIWSVRVPEAADGSWRFEQLFVNGRRATRARSPNGSWHPVAAAWEKPADGKPADGQPGGQTGPLQQGLELEPEGFGILQGVSPRTTVRVGRHTRLPDRGRFAGDRGRLQAGGLVGRRCPGRRRLANARPRAHSRITRRAAASLTV